MKKCARCDKPLPRFSFVRMFCDDCAKWRREHPEIMRQCIDCGHFKTGNLADKSIFSSRIPESQCLKRNVMLPLYGIENCADWTQKGQ